MWEYTARDELYHYGVLGMKWGIRRYQPYSVKPRASGLGGKEIGDLKKKSVRGVRVDHLFNPHIKVNRGDQTTAKEKADKAKEALDKWTTASIKQGKDKANKSPAQVVTTETKKITEDMDKIRKAKPSRTSFSDKVEEMSDDDLRKAIKRLELEKRFIDLSATDIKEGKSKFEMVMDILGPAVGITASIATIISVINEVRNG